MRDRDDFLPTATERDILRAALAQGTSRRALMTWLAAAGMSLSAAGTVLGQASRALAATPKPGGRIRVAAQSTSTADTVDPAKSSLSTDYARCRMFYNGLTVFDERLAPVMELAESFESKDATDWTIKLRDGIRFHDGKPFTSADVVFSLKRHQDPAVGSKAKSLAAQMKTIEAKGPLEVHVVLEAPNADLPVVLATSHFLIVQDGATDFSKAVGTGPYVCQEFEPGVRSIAVKNQEYWKEGKPYLDEIEFMGIPDENARVNALLSGDVDLIAAINPSLTRRVKMTDGYSIFETKSGNYNDMILRQDATPSKNPDLGLALKLLMNREQMQSTVFQGYAVVANDQPIDPSNRFYNPNLPQRPYDPDKAKFHLDKSGFANTKIPMYAMAGATMFDQAILLQQTARDIGLEIELKRMPPDGYWSNVWMKHPVTWGNINPRPSADILLTLFYKSDSPWNETGWKNERFDKLLVDARGESDVERRAAMYYEMQELVRDHSGIGIPLFNSLLDAHVDKLKGLRPIPTGGLMGYNFAENVWLEG